MAAHIDPEAWAKKVRIRKIVLLAVTAALIIGLGSFFLLRDAVLPAIACSKAERRAEQGDVPGAVELYLSAGSYKDASRRAAELAYSLQPDDSLRQTLKSAKLCDQVCFGSCEQDNDPENGPEPIRWLVLAKEDGKALLWSCSVLDAQPFNTVTEGTTWAACSLRQWLNESFYEDAFSDAERVLIPKTKLVNKGNGASMSTGGKDTVDRVFILSFSELLQYGWNNPELQGIYAWPTDYAVARGAAQHDAYQTCYWWIRTPGAAQSTAHYCNLVGSPLYYGPVGRRDIGVRPAVWVLVDEDGPDGT